MSQRADDGTQRINVHDANSVLISVPLEKWAEDLMDRVLARHVASCPVAPRVALVETRTSKIELSFGKLIGYMIGSGLCSGASVIAAMKFFVK